MANKPVPPADVIHEDSEPPITEAPQPLTTSPHTVVVAQIEEPMDDAVRKSPQPVQAAKRRRKKA